MKREILFRGWNEKNKKWLYGYYVRNFDIDYILEEIDPFRFSVKNENKIVVSDSIGQYTGLKDYKGNRIFEGDVIVINHVLMAKVLWHDGAFRCIELQSDNYNNIIDAGTLFRNNEVSIAGNIFDNPKLLK